MLGSRSWRAVAGLAALAVLTAACGDDDDDAADETTSTIEAEMACDSTDTIEVTAVDYAFEGVPEEIDCGASFSLTNESTAEVHEILAFLVPEGETRGAEELLNLSDEELGAVFGGEPEPVLVNVALPEEDGQVFEGTGSLTEPGRYILACFVPVGAPVEAYQGPPEGDGEGEDEGPPEIPDAGPPHFTQGMFAEVTVS